MPVVTKTDLPLPLLASGKVRDVYEIPGTSDLLFVATDRISCYDVVLKNGIPNKGSILTLISAHWFSVLKELIPELRTHFITLDLPSSLQDPATANVYRNRSMQVRKLKVFPIESIVRGYISGSAWESYKKTGKVNGMTMPEGLKESDKLEQPLWTPSTKAEQGANDENISPEQAAELVGKYSAQIEKLSLDIYKKARDYAAERGIIIADTKFEFALDTSDDSVVLVDEVLTPDSSRFWPASKYEPGKTQESLDKQFIRNWLTTNELKGKEGVELPADIVDKSVDQYKEAYKMLVGKD
ncbi:Bifunctional purine biosynthetic protein ade1 [Arachnomyces sp. PD_36]|nr:Bifunctional purine biosynthetic protein ade1 [Arachnomyces sp. PD_36]